MGRMQYAPTKMPNMPFCMTIFQIKKKVNTFCIGLYLIKKKIVPFRITLSRFK